MPNFNKKGADKTTKTRHNMQGDIFTVKDVENYLKVGHNNVSNLIISGRLSSFRVGNRRLITKSAIERFISEAEEEEKYNG